MDNKDFIRSLISFDDEGVDVSTGYVDIGSGARVWHRDRKKERDIIRRAKSAYEREGYDQLVFVNKDGEYTFTRIYDGWYDRNSWDIIKVIAVLATGYNRVPSVYKTYSKEGKDYLFLRMYLKSKGFPAEVTEKLIDDTQTWITKNL